MGRHSFTGIQIQLANLTIVKLHILFCSRASFAFRLPCSTTAVVVVPPRPEKFEEPTCFSLRLRISSCTRLLGQFQELPNSSIQPPEPSATMCKWTECGGSMGTTPFDYLAALRYFSKVIIMTAFVT